MFETAFVLLVVAALLTIVGICQPLAARLKLPPPVLLGVVGIALGSPPAVLAHFGWSVSVDVFPDIFVNLPIGSATYIYVFLPLLVFEAGLAADVRGMIEDAAPILLLAIVATLITTAMIGFALWPLASVPLVACLLLGAVVATTDPAAVIAIFRDVGAPARLIRLAEGEALLNDAAAIVLFAVLLGMIVTGRQPDIRLGSGRILPVLRRRRPVRVAGRPGLARADCLDARRSPGRGDADAGAGLRRRSSRPSACCMSRASSRCWPPA